MTAIIAFHIVHFKIENWLKYFSYIFNLFRRVLWCNKSKYVLYYT